MSKTDSLTSEELRRQVAYDPTTGRFTRLQNTTRSRAGSEAGAYISSNGYAYICVGGKKRLAHRLAWLYVYGRYPSVFIDHINGDKTDNRIENLRAASYADNSQNQRRPRSDNRLKTMGVVAHGLRFKAQLTIAGVSKYLGVFDTIADAHEAYVRAKRIHHPACTI